METIETIMPKEAVKTLLATRGKAVESYLATSLANTKDNVPHLHKAMQYSLEAGGKRLRPILCLSTGMAFGLREEDLMPFATALEYIHTYSLIHDDLPAMDDDDLRRGKPSCHKAFDEATAILAGDGLLTDAFTLMGSLVANPAIESKALLSAITEIAHAAGSVGMVGGQALDMKYTNAPLEGKPDFDALMQMYALKTGALFQASCVTGALLANAPPKDIDAIRVYAKNLGAAFQVVDDILDVTQDSETLGKPAGSDNAMNKYTVLSYMSLAEAQNFVCALSAKAAEALSPFDTPEMAFLRGLVNMLMHRIA